MSLFIWFLIVFHHCRLQIVMVAFDSLVFMETEAEKR